MANVKYACLIVILNPKPRHTLVIRPAGSQCCTLTSIINFDLRQLQMGLGYWIYFADVRAYVRIYTN